MVKISVKTLSLALVLILTMCLGALGEAVMAGESRGAAVPPRLQKVKQGDWILYRDDDGEFSLETATKIEEVENEYMVYYTIAEFDAAGKPKEEPQEVARFLSDEKKENAEFLKSMKGGKAERRTAVIDGKKVPIIAFISKEEDDGHVIEYWYSDAISIDGRVGMKVVLDEQHDYMPQETVAFGDAKTKPNVKKYLKKSDKKE